MKALCQDCLRVREYGSYEVAIDASCECGGEMCPCAGCQDTMSKLEQGFKDRSDLGTKVNILTWDKDNGATVAIINHPKPI